MRRHALAIVMLSMTSAALAGEPAAFFPPKTPSRPVVDVLHRTTLTDRYRWLENGKDAEVAAATMARARRSSSA